MDGGIVRTAEDTTSSGQQIKPNGMTVYYLVDDLGKVGSGPYRSFLRAS